jgi:hypothetical protein
MLSVPQMISSQVQPNNLGTILVDYDIYSTLDINRDGVKEVIV